MKSKIYNQLASAKRQLEEAEARVAAALIGSQSSLFETAQSQSHLLDEDINPRHYLRAYRIRVAELEQELAKNKNTVTVLPNQIPLL